MKNSFLPPLWILLILGAATPSWSASLPEVFLAAGTSGAVYPAAGLVDVARAYGAQTWLVNAEPADNVGRFERFVRGKSGEVLPSLFDVRGASPPRE